jgi:NADH:ubiquinone reductase (H+-translocating)
LPFCRFDPKPTKCNPAGSWAALYAVGWDRQVFSTGEDAKVVKQTIHRKRIYPPRTGVRSEILAAAAPIVQAPPQSRMTR